MDKDYTTHGTLSTYRSTTSRDDGMKNNSFFSFKFTLHSLVFPFTLVNFLLHYFLSLKGRFFLRTTFFMNAWFIIIKGVYLDMAKVFYLQKSIKWMTSSREDEKL